jgi:regulator of RNase E activity RraB
MSDSWDIYFATVNDEVAALFVDLGLESVAPDENRPWLCWAWIYMNQPREDGLTGAQEEPQLDRIEDELMEAVEDATAGELVGRITTAGRRELYFYGPTHIGFEDAIGRVMQQFEEYRFDTGVEQDPEWNHYLRVLYPSDHDEQRIKNRHVIEILEQHGDVLTKPRIVSHWAYFPTAGAREQFIVAARALRFQIIKEHEVEEGEQENRFCIVLERIDTVDWESINQVTIELFDLAQVSGGKYDGWETNVAEK